jgi:RND superfamily putative drug exporter
LSRWFVSQRPAWVVAAWVVSALAVGLLAPDLTRLAAEGQAKLLPRDSESARGAEVVREAWPDQWSESSLVAVLRRPGSLNDADRDFARRLADRIHCYSRPRLTSAAI